MGSLSIDWMCGGRRMEEQICWWKYYLGWVLKDQQELASQGKVGGNKIFKEEEFIEYSVILSTPGLKIVLDIISIYVENI